MSNTVFSPAVAGDQEPIHPTGQTITSEGHLVSHINTPPAQTWNYLRVNDISLELPQPRPAGDVYARLPRLFDAVECGVGKEAIRWAEGIAGDATYIEVKPDAGSNEPIRVEVTGGEHADVGVLVREDATATIAVLAAGGDGGDDDPSSTLVRIVAERNAQVNVVETVATTAGRTHLGGIGITAEEGTSIEVRQYALGRGTTALGIATELAGASARLAHTMRYLVQQDDLLDANHLVRMRGRNTRADVATNGILGEGAHKTLRETIDLSHGAKGARGNEAETVLVTGDAVVNKTLPTILCGEEDVAGNHGASIGGISAEQLDYLADRGLDERAAQDLFARAVFDDAMAHATTEAMRSAVLACATETLGAATAEEIRLMPGVPAATGQEVSPCSATRS